MISHATFEALLPFEGGSRQWAPYQLRKLESMRATGWLAGTPAEGYTITRMGKLKLTEYRARHGIKARA